MVGLKSTVVLLCLCVALFACDEKKICYAQSSAEIEEKIESGTCGNVYVSDVDEEVMKFVNDEPLVFVFINIDDNPGVRGVEADGRGDVSTNRIDEVVRTNTSCSGNASGARLLDITIGDDGNGGPGFCNFSADPGATVRLAAESGVTVGSIVASSNAWSDVALEVDESAWPTNKLTTSVMPLDVLQKFGSRMADVLLFVSDDDVLSAYFAWLDSEGYDGTVHVNSDDGQQTPVQVYPSVSE